MVNLSLIPESYDSHTYLGQHLPTYTLVRVLVEPRPWLPLVFLAMVSLAGAPDRDTDIRSIYYFYLYSLLLLFTRGLGGSIHEWPATATRRPHY
jgi:hypothetical protein